MDGIVKRNALPAYVPTGHFYFYLFERHDIFNAIYFPGQIYFSCPSILEIQNQP